MFIKFKEFPLLTVTKVYHPRAIIMVTETRHSKRLRRSPIEVCSMVASDSCQTSGTKVKTRLTVQQKKNDGSLFGSEPAESDLKTKDTKISQAFYCPLTMEVMVDPVLDIDGNTYERSALEEWLQDHHTSPVSRQPLSTKLLIPNNSLRDCIHEFMGKEWVKEQKEQRLQPVKQNNGEKLPVVGVTTPSTPSDGLIANGTGTTTLRSAASETFLKLRHRIDCYLQCLSRDLMHHRDSDGNSGLLSLSEQGLCAFRYEDITIVLDVPDQIGFFCLFTKNLVPGMSVQNSSIYTTAQRNAMIHRAMELNFLQGGTRGGCLSVTPAAKQIMGGIEDEITFSYTDRILEVTKGDFSNIILNFVETCVDLRNQLLLASVMTLQPMVELSTGNSLSE